MRSCVVRLSYLFYMMLLNCLYPVFTPPVITDTFAPTPTASRRSDIAISMVNWIKTM
jgi:hypothetical protein